MFCTTSRVAKTYSLGFLIRVLLRAMFKDVFFATWRVLIGSFMCNRGAAYIIIITTC